MQPHLFVSDRPPRSCSPHSATWRRDRRHAAGEGAETAQPMTETRYARSGDVHIAYQVFGEGARCRARQRLHHAHRWLGARAGQALPRSAGVLCAGDPLRSAGVRAVDRLPSSDARGAHGDVRAVMDAAEVERAALIGVSREPRCAFSRRDLPRASASLVLSGGMARTTLADDYRSARPPRPFSNRARVHPPHWGDGRPSRWPRRARPTTPIRERSSAAWSG